MFLLEVRRHGAQKVRTENPPGCRAAGPSWPYLVHCYPRLNADSASRRKIVDYRVARGPRPCDKSSSPRFTRRSCPNHESIRKHKTKAKKIKDPAYQKSPCTLDSFCDQKRCNQRYSTPSIRRTLNQSAPDHAAHTARKT